MIQDPDNMTGINSKPVEYDYNEQNQILQDFAPPDLYGTPGDAAITSRNQSPSELPSPEGLTGKTVAADMVNLSWLPVAGAAGYKVRHNGTTVEDKGAETSIYWGSLGGGRNTFEVQAYGNGRQSSFSQPISLILGSSTQQVATTAAQNFKGRNFKVKKLSAGQPMTRVPTATGTKAAIVTGGTAAAQPDDDTIFGFPSTYVYIGGAVAAVALIYVYSGKK